MFSIKYGLINNNTDVTKIVFDKLKKNNIIHIPSTDIARSKYFGDNLPGILKSIFVIDNKGNKKEYDYLQEIFIDVNNYNIDPYDRLKNIHTKLKIDYGNLNEEYHEQIMVSKYLNGDEKVLEIGGNIGRNSIVIGYILKEKNNNSFVTLESDTNISKQLIHNRDINNLNFNIENSALSKRNLIQIGWDTIVSDVVLPGFFKVNTITLEQLNNKYNINFDTLVLDCEGAFYYILMDMPEILNNIKLIIMENDYNDITKKNYVDEVLKNNNFYIDYSLEGGWGPCKNNFYEVWKRLY
jgi:FkbM family methyltransferase